MIEFDVDLPSELVPLSWLLGEWEGSGLVEYDAVGERRQHEISQRVSFSHDGLAHLVYTCSTRLVVEPESADPGPTGGPAAFTTETGYWRLSRLATRGDPGPGLLPGVGAAPYTTASAVETLRNPAGGFDIEVWIIHPVGVGELYLGQVMGPRIDLATDAVVRAATAKEHSASTRLYGLVDGDLLWAWDIAALGQPLASHASGRLARVS